MSSPMAVLPQLVHKKSEHVLTVTTHALVPVPRDNDPAHGEQHQGETQKKSRLNSLDEEQMKLPTKKEYIDR